ncbi:MAG: PilT/PilU family type 4a pilus ATPase, partial [Candidatus Sericytochromatia bacterium]|nr:PilT/PilU family type 4a pilus ATPase [Candidatus Sericytochromatia bacterium]
MSASGQLVSTAELPCEAPAMAATGRYLAAVPVLADLLREELAPRLSRSTTDGEFRALRRDALQAVVTRQREAKHPYKVIHFAEEQVPCKMEGCRESVVGVYVEIVNPVTRADLKIPARIAHNLTHHASGLALEPLRNMGNSPFGDAEVQLDAAAVRKILTQLDVPGEVLDELAQWERVYPVPRRTPEPYVPLEPTPQEQSAGIHPLFNVLAHLVEYGCADIHIKAGHPPCGVLRGQVTPFEDFGVLTPETTRYYVESLMSEKQRRIFDESREMDLAFPVPGIGRFRCNIYQAQGAAGMVLRVIANEILPAEVLGLPAVLKKTVFERQGLILITGQTGSGKTTSLAALIDFANGNRRIHVLTLENPVEFVYEPKQAIFTQREMEVDSMSFSNAMRGALRQKPDIILIGEMRDAETITSGLKAAETGHLVMSTLHTNDAIQTINRLINTFPPHEQEGVRLQLASALKASVAQRLIPRADKPGRVASLEIFLVTPNARGENTKAHIQKGNTDALYQILRTSEYDGMQSQNQALFKHYCNAVISADDALANSDNPDELVRLMREHA